ncbi:MAG: 1-deoxy-D-xylulose-5-phosphate reductoisomerase [Actinomycetia bacterium]|nr:1-deoxy-D-xylulose-5-phosphate reductoisomerase [Actinomycetes bacterium]MCP3909361.1 1-deoxy-D-xylulose-5-phosphate reductoisomerase [Actinomycetes bacterium]MCP4087620.1 1-deoxy-D-xylulose-5-phosphate reductoisomerase [Actinomycetes bacterium]
MTNVAVCGSTGSIGTQTLEVIETEAGPWRVSALGVNSSVDAVVEQAHRVRPDVVAVAAPEAAAGLAARLPAGTELLVGPNAMAEAAQRADVVVNGVVGFAGLSVTLATLEAGKRLALANKESLIAAGPVVQRARLTPGAELVPVDSEHCAIHQCLRANNERARLDRIVLTASGGPFRGRSRSELSEVTVEAALAHPTWSMGPKITIDSSTLMNKGLEVIEANELFGRVAGPDAHDLGIDDIEVVVHPQSIVHSMVEFSDGATIAQLSLPDMRLPIGYALAHPDRITTPFGRIDWAETGRLDFEPPDYESFPCLGLAYEAGRAGETAPAALNAANEVAVEAFLDGRIRWIVIPDVLKVVLDGHDGSRASDVDAVLAVDAWARREASSFIEGLN